MQGCMDALGRTGKPQHEAALTRWRAGGILDGQGQLATESPPLMLIPADMDVQGWIMLAAGAALLLGGWALYKLAVWASGAVLGAATGWGLGVLAVHFWGAPPVNELAIKVLLAVAGLLVGVVLFRVLSSVAFFVAGAVLAAWGLVEALARLEAGGVAWANDWWTVLVAPPVAALVGGLLASLYTEYVLVVASCAGGTWLVMEALGWPLGWTGALVVMAVGLVLQTALVRAALDRETRRDEE